MPGSSPRMRGALYIRLPDTRVVRIIPADAGSTASMSSRPTRTQDHPRGCGEHNSLSEKSSYSSGSSPRMRGAQSDNADEDSDERIIPADAGSTDGTLQGGTPAEDHPRGCGEHSELLVGFEYFRGSSPRMRGAPAILDLSVA